MPVVYNKRRDLLIPHDAVYVGRGSKWGNPYRIGRDGDREDVIRRFTRHLFRSGLYFALDEIRGKDLLCFCTPLACHGVVLLHLANRFPYESLAEPDLSEVRAGPRVDHHLGQLHVGDWRMPELRREDLGFPKL